MTLKQLINPKIFETFFLITFNVLLKDQALNGNIEIDTQNQIFLSMKVDLENQQACKTEQLDRLQIEYNDVKVAYKSKTFFTFF